MEDKVLAELAKRSSGLDIRIQDLRRILPSGGLMNRRFGKRNIKDVIGVCWHQALSWGSVEAIAKFHTGPHSTMAKNGHGLEAIPYTWAIRRDGSICLCNKFKLKTWSQGTKSRKGDENKQFMAVLFCGKLKGQGVHDKDAKDPTLEQIQSGIILWTVLRDLLELGGTELHGHFEFGKPACPGDTLERVVKAIRSNARKKADRDADELDLAKMIDRQKALIQLGYANHVGVADDNWGPKSKGALVQFQRDNDLTVDGLWGPRTEAAIRAKL